MSAARRANALSLALAVAAFASALLLFAAPALGAAPRWRIDTISNTATAAPNSSFEYQVVAYNEGDAPTAGKIELLVELPAGMVAKSTKVYNSSDPPATISCFDAADGVSPVAGATSVVCPSTSTVGATYFLKLILLVEVQAGATGPLLAHSTVSGGGAVSASTVDPTELSSTPPPFGIDSFDTAVLDAGGAVSTLAGAHPAADVTSFAFNTLTDPSPRRGAVWPVEPPRDVYAELPPGLTGNPATMGQCTLLQLSNGRRPLCPPDSQLGKVTITTKSSLTLSNAATVPVFNITPPPGAAARFAFNVAGTIVVLDGRVRNGSDYGVTIGASMLPEALAIPGSEVEIWGNPSDESHDLERACPGKDNPFELFGFSAPADCPADYTRPADQAFLRNPTSCTMAGEGLVTSLRADSWVQPGVFDERSSASHKAPGFPYPPEEWGPQVGIEECESEPFEPSLTGGPPAGQAAAKPSGFSFDLTMPQHGLEETSAISESDLRKAVVTLPEGVSLNPSSASGLGACTPAQIGLLTPVGDEHPEYTPGPANCPENAKVGNIEIQTPLLDHPIQGAAYIAQQQQNPFGSLLALYLVASDPISGVNLKLAGRVQLDPNTGQVTTVFDNTPQQPFTSLHLALKSGPRAPLIAPDRCGDYAIKTTFEGWSGKVVHGEAPFTISTACPTGAFSPKLSAGTQNPLAGTTSPFNLRITREDGEAALGGLQVKMPPGLSGYLNGISYCPDAALAAVSGALGTGRAQEASPSCPASSQVGTVTVGAGAGPNPFFTTSGRAYLAGPYKGAPLSLAVVTPAVAGPFDLGSVLVRNALHLDSETAQITAVSDPLPTSLYGIPLDLRDVRVNLDRPHFTLNPTSCDAMSIQGTIASASGQSASPSQRFQVAGCEALPFKPRLTFALRGKTKRSGNPSLRATLTARPGDANIGAVRVALPSSEYLDQSHIRTICTRVQFAAGGGGGEQCPAGSVYGHVVATSPIVDYALEGPVILRSSSHELPDMVAVVHGPASQPVTVAAVGRIDSVNEGIRSTFESFPDVPISKIVLTMQGGKKGLLENSANLCAAKHRATVEFDAQNGKFADSRPLLKPRCPKKKKSKRPAQHKRHR